MNKFEPKSRAAADHEAVSDAMVDDLSKPPAAPDAGEPPEPARAPLTRGEVRTIMLSLMLSMFLSALDQTIVATALPTIGRQFHDTTSLSWIITAYLLSATAVAPVFGALSDIYGRRFAIVTATGLFMVGSLFCAIAPNLLTLILARALQGLGGGGLLPIVQTIISDVVSPRERGEYQGYFSAVFVGAGISGPILGGVFAEHLHWSMIFWINLPLGVLALAMLLPKMKKIPVFHRRRKVDWLGGVLLMASAVAIILVLTWGGTRFAWMSPTILAMLGVAAVMAFAFIWHALHTEQPFLPLPLLSGPVVPLAMAAGSCAMGALIGITVHMPLYYGAVYHLTASETGLAMIPSAAIGVGGAAIAGRVMTRTKHYKRVAIIGSSLSVALALVVAVATPLPLWAVLALLSMFSLGIGTVFPVTLGSIQNAVARSQVGTATGAMNFFRALMGSFVVAAFTTIVLISLGTGVSINGEHAAVVHDVAQADMVTAFRYVFAGGAVLMAISSFCVTLMEERPLAGPETRLQPVAE
jgi:EmrB/QacA subfamily drug resistance transporter